MISIQVHFWLNFVPDGQYLALKTVVNVVSSTEPATKSADITHNS